MRSPSAALSSILAEMMREVRIHNSRGGGGGGGGGGGRFGVGGGYGGDGRSGGRAGGGQGGRDGGKGGTRTRTRTRELRRGDGGTTVSTTSARTAAVLPTVCGGADSVAMETTAGGTVTRKEGGHTHTNGARSDGENNGPNAPHYMRLKQVDETRRLITKNRRPRLSSAGLNF